MADTPVLDIAGLNVVYRTPRGALQVLRNVSLQVAPGEVAGLVGESGSGKSTLAYAAMRYLSPNAEILSGAIRLNGDDLLTLSQTELGDIRGNRLAMVYQDPNTALNPALTLGEQIIELLVRHRDISRRHAAQDTVELLRMVTLPDPAFIMTKYPHQVSGGEKQRVLIAMAFGCEPDCLVFDEPTTALDATTAAGILDLLRRLRDARGIAALYISHDLGTVSEICQTTSVIYAGQIVETATTADLYRDPQHPYTRSLMASRPNPFGPAPRRRLTAFGGMPPQMYEPPAGCAFQARCPFVKPACSGDGVKLPTTGSHRTACIRWQDTRQSALPSPETSETEHLATAAPVLSFSDLVVNYGRRTLWDDLTRRPQEQVQAVAGVSLEIPAGATVGLVGESGCGKSTLARALVGLVPFSGSIQLDGRSYDNAKALDAPYRSAVQIIFQHPDLSLNPRHKIKEIIRRPLLLHGGMSGREANRTVVSLLDQVRLPKAYVERYPHQLSGGEKQRVAIARAFGLRPRLVICDEITSGLDASVQASIVNLLADLQDEIGTAYLFITHDLNLVQHIADQVAIMYLGRLAELRGAEGLYRPPYHPYTEALLSAVPTPDPSVTARRILLEGTPPSPKNPPPGCRFSGRCPRNLGDICAQEAPPLRQFSDDHWLNCHLPEAELRHLPDVWVHAAPIES